MRTQVRAATVAALISALSVAPALAETPIEDGAVVMVDTLDAEPEYPVLTRGQVVLVNAQRYVVTQEPPPLARVAEAPPAQPATSSVKPAAPDADAIWVDAHWSHGPKGLSWVTGRYVLPRAGHVFVPPRWASLDGQYLFFSGFYVPRGVYVRSHFNRYYYSGVPTTQPGSNLGPYWPVGAPTQARSAATSANARDPYWPIGAPR